MNAFPSLECWLAHRVSYGETDAMGVVYHAEYLHYFERGRSHFIRELGRMSYREMEEHGIGLPVRDAFCRYRLPARYDDLIQIRVGLEKMGSASMTFLYEIYNQERTALLTEGKTTHACVDTATGKPVRMPDWVRHLFSEKDAPCA